MKKKGEREKELYEKLIRNSDWSNYDGKLDVKNDRLKKKVMICRSERGEDKENQ